MINNLTTGIHLTNNTYSHPYVGNNGQGAGNVRYNTSTQQMEVYDGAGWLNITQNASIGLDWTAEQAIRWVTDKMAEEANLKERMEKHPGLKDAYEKFKVMDILTKEEA